jgi:hypothetical protein
MDATKLRYLKEAPSTVDARRFAAWKSALYTLGIPFSDVMRVLAACLLLGNVFFVEAEGDDLDLEGQHGVTVKSARGKPVGVPKYRTYDQAWLKGSGGPGPFILRGPYVPPEAKIFAFSTTESKNFWVVQPPQAKYFAFSTAGGKKFAYIFVF